MNIPTHRNSYKKYTAIRYVFGLFFYIVLYFLLKVELHFVHIWGIEFVLNIIVMLLVSMIFQRKNDFQIKDVGVINLKEWKLAKPVSLALIFITLSIYFLLGNV